MLQLIDILRQATDLKLSMKVLKNKPEIAFLNVDKNVTFDFSKYLKLH